MEVKQVMAQVIVSDVEASAEFYRRLFGREPDARPMDRLAEWHHPGAGAVQVYEEPERAGCSGVTINVSGLDDYIALLDAAGISHEPPGDATYARLITLRDPDRNRIVITE